jgi:hypothetical protein
MVSMWLLFHLRHMTPYFGNAFILGLTLNFNFFVPLQIEHAYIMGHLFIIQP